MTHLFINSNNEYPRHIGDILIDHPDYDGINLPDGWHKVKPIEPPTLESNQVLEETYPEIVNGVYVQSWSVRPMTTEEIERNSNPPQSWEEAKRLINNAQEVGQ
jgi:hypothetical protein